MFSREMAVNVRQPLGGQGVGRIYGHKQRKEFLKKGENLVRISTVNVGTMVGKSREVVEMLARRNVDICCVQETRYRGAGSKTIGSDKERYKFWWSGNKMSQSGVGILVREEMVEDVIEIKRTNDRIMKIKIVLGGSVMHIFSAYAPQVGRTEEEKQEFWERLSDEVTEVPHSEGVLLGGDLNGHVGTDRSGFEDVMGGFGFGERNGEGEDILEFCQSQRLRIINTMFQKSREKLITYKSGGAETQIDFILMRKMDNICQKNCTVIPGEACLTQHRLLRLELTVKGRRKMKRERVKRIKFWKLKNEEVRKMYEEKVSSNLQARTGKLEPLHEGIRKAAEEVCGMTSGRGHRERETWWWNEDVQRALEEKKKSFKLWQRTKSEEDREIYKVKKREAKRQVAQARRIVLEEWSQNLNTAEGKNRMFKIAQSMRKDRKDVKGAKYIKDENGEIKIKEEEIMSRWKQYFEKLLNECNEYDLEDVSRTEGPIENVTSEEVKGSLKKMKNGKAPGPSGITSDLLKAAGEPVVEELHRIYENIMKEEKGAKEWEESLTTVVFKGKGDALECGNYRGIRLLEHSMKVWEKILEERLRKIVKINKCQFGFMPGKSTTEAITAMRQLQEKCRQKRRGFVI